MLASTGPRSYSGRSGIANGFGGKGVNAQCEYLITGPGIGTGVCLFSDGAAYPMHFGSWAARLARRGSSGFHEFRLAAEPAVDVQLRHARVLGQQPGRDRAGLLQQGAVLA